MYINCIVKGMCKGKQRESTLSFRCTDLKDAKYQALNRIANDFNSWDINSITFTNQFNIVLENRTY